MNDVRDRAAPEIYDVDPRVQVFVQRLSTLYPLSPRELEAAAGLVQDFSRVAPHQDILHELHPAKEALVLLEGLACHYRAFDTARRQMTGFVVPGDFCDFGFLSSSPVRHSVMSLGHAVIGRVDLAQLAAVGQAMPNVVVAVMRAAAVEQACARELVISLGARDALQRLAHFLCEMNDRLSLVGLASGEGQFDLAMTQAELGEALGLSTVHVNRTIQQLRKRGLITLGQGTVSVLNRQGLAAAASYDGQYLVLN